MNNDTSSNNQQRFNQPNMYAMVMIIIALVSCWLLPFMGISYFSSEWGEQPSLHSIIQGDEYFTLESIRDTAMAHALIVCFAGGIIALFFLFIKSDKKAMITLAITLVAFILCCCEAFYNLRDYIVNATAFYAILGPGVFVSFICYGIAVISSAKSAKRKNRYRMGIADDKLDCS